METKKYSSYAEIDRELEILKLEKEIYYRKISYSVQKTKESLTPNSLVTGIISSSDSLLTGPYGAFIAVVTPFLMNKVVPFVKKWILKKI